MKLCFAAVRYGGVGDDNAGAVSTTIPTIYELTLNRAHIVLSFIDRVAFCVCMCHRTFVVKDSRWDGWWLSDCLRHRSRGR